MRQLAPRFIALVWVFSSVQVQAIEPSRPPEKNCFWEKQSSESAGLGAWVQRCKFDRRKINLLFKGMGLYLNYSDGGEPIPLVEVFDLMPNETYENGIGRLFAEHTAKETSRRCVMEAMNHPPAPPRVLRYTFVPNASYKLQLARQSNSGDIPEPPCGDWGSTSDGVQYFEAQPDRKVNKVLFVRVGQDRPLFDENTLQLLGRSAEVKTP